MRTIQIVFFTTLVIGFLSCTPKLYTEDKDLTIQDAFTQKEIPGQEFGKKHTYLKINFKLADGKNIYIDSLTFRDITTPISSPAKSIKLQLNAAHLAAKPTAKNETAVLYFTKDGKAYKKVVENIVKQKDLYLP